MGNPADFAHRNEREANERRATQAVHTLANDPALIRQLIRNHPDHVLAACHQLGVPRP